MYEHVSVVGERGQITLPKAIRDKEGLKPEDKVIVKIEEDKIVVEKLVSKQEKKRQMIEGYRYFSGLDGILEENFKYSSSEADAMLDDY